MHLEIRLVPEDMDRFLNKQIFIKTNLLNLGPFMTPLTYLGSSNDVKNCKKKFPRNEIFENLLGFSAKSCPDNNDIAFVGQNIRSNKSVSRVESRHLISLDCRAINPF